jgi:hypothetical protein
MYDQNVPRCNKDQAKTSTSRGRCMHHLMIMQNGADASRGRSATWMMSGNAVECSAGGVGRSTHLWLRLRQRHQQLSPPEGRGNHNNWQGCLAAAKRRQNVVTATPNRSENPAESEPKKNLQGTPGQEGPRNQHQQQCTYLADTERVAARFSKQQQQQKGKKSARKMKPS